MWFSNILTSFIHSSTTPTCHIFHTIWPHHHFPLYDVKAFSSYLTSCTLRRYLMARINPRPSFLDRTLSVRGQGRSEVGNFWNRSLKLLFPILFFWDLKSQNKLPPEVDPKHGLHFPIYLSSNIIVNVHSMSLSLSN